MSACARSLTRISPPATAGRQYSKHRRLGWRSDLGHRLLLPSFRHDAFRRHPELVAVHKEQEEHLDVERTATAIVDFGRGQTLHFTASSGSSLQQSVTLVGTDGWAKLDVPFNASRVTTARWAHRDETPNTMLGTGIEVTFEPCDQYQLMVEDFARAVTEERKADLSESRHLTRILGARVAA